MDTAALNVSTREVLTDCANAIPFRLEAAKSI
jgi:hypothetical protein